MTSLQCLANSQIPCGDVQRLYRGFPIFLMSFAASHSGCQASTKIGATPAHTGKVHTQILSCLCFVSTERTRQASCCTSGRRELNFALTWIAFVFASKTWLEKWQLSHGFAVDGAYFLGFSTVLSEKCNCHTVSLWGRAYCGGPLSAATFSGTFQPPKTGPAFGWLLPPRADPHLKLFEIGKLFLNFQPLLQKVRRCT